MDIERDTLLENRVHSSKELLEPIISIKLFYEERMEKFRGEIQSLKKQNDLLKESIMRK